MIIWYHNDIDNYNIYINNLILIVILIISITITISIKYNFYFINIPFTSKWKSKFKSCEIMNRYSNCNLYQLEIIIMNNIIKGI